MSRKPCASRQCERGSRPPLMLELRWILLVLGILFIAGLALWESARRRRLPTAPSAPEDPIPHRFREPSMGLPEIRARVPAQDLPVIEMDDESLEGLRIEQMSVHAQPRYEPEPESEPALLSEAPTVPKVLDTLE